MAKWNKYDSYGLAISSLLLIAAIVAIGAWHYNVWSQCRAAGNNMLYCWHIL